jgi:hypothetical protein
MDKYLTCLMGMGWHTPDLHHPYYFHRKKTQAWYKGCKHNIVGGRDIPSYFDQNME